MKSPTVRGCRNGAGCDVLTRRRAVPDPGHPGPGRYDTVRRAVRGVGLVEVDVLARRPVREDPQGGADHVRRAAHEDLAVMPRAVLPDNLGQHAAQPGKARLVRERWDHPQGWAGCFQPAQVSQVIQILPAAGAEEQGDTTGGPCSAGLPCARAGTWSPACPATPGITSTGAP